MLLRGFISDAKSIGTRVTLQQFKWSLSKNRFVPGVIYGVDEYEIKEDLQSIDFSFFTDCRYYPKENRFKSLPKVAYKKFTFPSKIRFTDTTIEKMTVSDTALYYDDIKFDKQSTRMLTLTTSFTSEMPWDVVLKYNYPSHLLFHKNRGWMYKPYYKLHEPQDPPREDW